MRRIKYISLALFMLTACFVYVPFNAHAETDSIIIHYHRDDGDYAKWNIWAWPSGGEGAAYPFNGEDDFGMVADIKISKASDKIGFIIRTDSWEKDTGDDRFIDVTQGTEIWVFSGQTEFTYDPPEGYGGEDPFENIDLTLHYYRYDNKYDGISFDIDGRSPSNYSVSQMGADVTITVPYSRRLTVTATLGGVSETFSVPTSKISDAGKLEAYLVQGRESAFFEPVNTVPKLEKAVLYSVNELLVSFSVPITVLNSGIVVKTAAGTAVSISSETPMERTDSVYKNIVSGYSDTFLLKVSTLSLSEQYKVYDKEGASMSVTIPASFYESDDFRNTFTYRGSDLGAVYSPEKTVFKVWAPTASSLDVCFYNDGDPNSAPVSTAAMTRAEHGVWEYTASGDKKNVYYMYKVTVGGETKTVVDPYAKGVGVNGMRGMVIDLNSTDPAGFDSHSRPAFTEPTDAVIYELHVRDLSTHADSGIVNKGKFLALTERGTKNSDGLATGIDHILNLGITHIHLLPSYDFKTVDESKPENNEFNWGYDPQNYNVPEGSYSTNPYDGNVRVKEFKQMVMAAHEAGLRIVMDVVYNHMYSAGDSAFEALVPGYYFRLNSSGGYANGSACGNETASEREMMRKFIVDSVVYWATEYKVDGFRFDLMALHDIETMNAVREALNEIDPTILVYGEGWTGAASPLPDNEKALKESVSKMNEHIAVFSDDIRDGIKGSVFNATGVGFINSKSASGVRDMDIRFGIVGSVKHPQISIGLVSSSKTFWAAAPTQTVTYASAHDNLSLWDKLKATNPDDSDEQILKLNKLSAAIVLTSQGIPFFQAGEEMARTKSGVDNSYKSPDSINQLNWSAKKTYNDLIDYYTGLISIRKANSGFRMTTAEGVRDNLIFLDTEEAVVAYTLKQNDNEETPELAVIFNGALETKTVTIPSGTWAVYADGDKASPEALRYIKGGKVKVPAKTALVLGKSSSGAPANIGMWIAIGGIAAVIGFAGAYFGFGRKRRKNKAG